MFTLTDTLTILEAYDLSLVVVGLGVLGLATLLHRFQGYPFSFPILALSAGYAAFALPLDLPSLDPREHGAIALHLTELGVIVSLMGVGLKIDRLLQWRTWSATWRLLGICMPLTIAGVATLAWYLIGLEASAAVLLGAALAPTDPVLASDVQVGKPDEEIPEGSKQAESEEASNETDPTEKEDELRFTLTAEAGLNDSLAFPFTYLAILMLNEGLSPTNWIGQWVLVDLVYRLVVALIAGVAIGWGLSRLLLRVPVESEQERMRAGVGSLAATLLLYGVTEILGGYGFLAVFIGGVTIRHSEQTMQSHRSMHAFAEQTEQLFMTVTLLALGGAIAGGLLAPLTWAGVALGLLLVFVLRPAAGMISLLGEQRLSLLDRGIVSFFGVRGIGCLFYLAYGAETESFSNEDTLWAVCSFAVVLSVIVHGIAAAPVMQFRDQRLRRKKQQDGQRERA
ncbi:cation:proton antiporter [Novipirellula caenicola]|uniref:K(+)/H(+) antiporter NhaP2 n=1 Tax=Novipirellula caenicola TaxID=1536901 RepID=A0ABP9VPP2_9BACT